MLRKLIKNKWVRSLILGAVALLAIGYLNICLAANNSLRYLAENRGIFIGAAVAIAPLQKDNKYREVLAREFNLVTAENVMKFDRLHPERDRYNFTNGDAIIDFAKNNDMQVRGHTLVWHHSLPKWLTEGNFSREELIAILQKHIFRVVTHFRGQVIAWDVVNEAIDDDGSLRKTIWLQKIGPEYIELAFRWAHQADPQAKLFYNDYGGEGSGKKSDAIYALIQQLLQRGVPIHGVGLQMHVSVKNPPSPQAVATNIQRLAALGLEVNITEMDVQIQDGTGTEAERLSLQANIYQNMLNACLSVRSCKAFVLWGFTDKHSWIPWFTGKPDAPLIFDKSYHPKPAYYALREALVKR